MSNSRPFRLKAPRLNENDVERACLDLLKLRSYWAARLHAGTFKSVDGARWIKGVAKGTPDYGALHEIYPGFLIEVKRPGEKPSREQEFRHWEIRAGYRIAIAVVDNVASLATWLDAHEQSARERWAGFLTVRQVRGP